MELISIFIDPQKLNEEKGEDSELSYLETVIVFFSLWQNFDEYIFEPELLQYNINLLSLLKYT